MSIKRNLAAVVSAACALACASGAAAQATRTWVSGVGDDANPCSRTAPCKTFAGAISKTGAGGEINTLDPGGFGTVTITKAITIGTDPAYGGILNASTNGIIINAGVNDNVVLRGLTIQGARTGLNGVRFLAGKSLTLENVYISGNNTATPNGNGVLFAPSTGTSTLTITDTVIFENGDLNAATGAAVQIAPTGSASVQAVLSNVSATGHATGLRADASNTSGVVRVTASNSAFAGNVTSGVTALSASGFGNTSVSLQNVTTANNSQGLTVDGPNTTVRFGFSSIVGNMLGVQQVNGGVAQSYGNNVIGNISGADGTWTTAPLR